MDIFKFSVLKTLVHIDNNVSANHINFSALITDHVFVSIPTREWKNIARFYM